VDYYENQNESYIVERGFSDYGEKLDEALEQLVNGFSLISSTFSIFISLLIFSNLADYHGGFNASIKSFSEIVALISGLNSL